MARVLLVRHGETVWNRQGRVQGWAPTSLSDRGREQARALAAALSEPAADAEASSGPQEPGAAATAPRSVAGREQNADPAVGGADATASPDGSVADSDGLIADEVSAIDGTVDRLVTSDLPRARETAAAVEGTTGCRATGEARWRERNMGRLEGLPAHELFERYPHLSLKYSGEAAAQRAPEGGETLVETRERVLDAWDRLRADLGASETAVVVSHSCPISLLLGHLQDVPLTEAVLERPQNNGAVNEIYVDDRVNDSPDAGDRSDTGTGVRLVRENWTAYRSRHGTG